MASVYLLHFKTKLHHAGHYCGYTPNGVEARVKLHRSGRGAKLTAAVAEAGIEMVIAKTWRFGDNHEARLFERACKDTHQLGRLCPVCRAKAK